MRLMKGTQQVFAVRSVNTRFASHGTVDLADDSGRNLHTGDTTLENGRAETCEISNDSSAQCYEKGFPVETGPEHLATHVSGPLHAFGCFTGWNGYQDRINSGRIQRGFHGFGIKRPDVGISDDRCLDALD